MTPDSPPVNAAQIELWNGRGGEIWTRHQEHLDVLFTPLTAALLTAAAPKPLESAVDIGCGCGDLTLQAAQACGADGRVLAVDISTPMLARAKAREESARATRMDMAPIQWLEADAMLHRFEQHADLVMSRFGVMFFADPIAAFANIRQVLKPTGRLAILCWAAIEKNPWIHVPLDAVHRLIEPSPPLPLGAPGPFAFADASRVLKILSDAGFRNVTAQMIEVPIALGRAAKDAADPLQSALNDALVLALESGPVAALLRTADETLRLKLRDQIAAALKPYFREDERAITLMAGCQLYQARAA